MERKLRYPGNDPENGPAEWHVMYNGRWVPEREIKASFQCTSPDWALIRDIPEAIKYGRDLDFEKYMVAAGDANNLCNEFEEDGCPTPAGIKKAEVFIARAQNWTSIAWKLYGLWQGYQIASDIFVCATTGHRLKDDSYGGPDSGAMGAHCTRCGWSWHHTLY